MIDFKFKRIIKLCKNSFNLSLEKDSNGNILLSNNNQLFGVLNEDMLELRIADIQADVYNELPVFAEPTIHTNEKEWKLIELNGNTEFELITNAISRAYSYTLCEEGKALIKLSADGDIAIYKADKAILDNIYQNIDEFYNRKKTNCYDETLFIEFLKGKYGKASITFFRYDKNDVKDKGIFWYNF